MVNLRNDLELLTVNSNGQSLKRSLLQSRDALASGIPVHSSRLFFWHALNPAMCATPSLLYGQIK